MKKIENIRIMLCLPALIFPNLNHFPSSGGRLEIKDPEVGLRQKPERKCAFFLPTT